MSDFNFSDYINRIKGAKTPEEVAAIQFDAPGLIDRGMGYGDKDVLSLLTMQKARKEDLQQKAAVPVISQLADYKNQGWSSDPSFTGKEWTEGLLNTPAFNAPGTPAPDMKNPNILAAVTGFAGEAQRESSYAEQLQRGGASVQDAGSISRFALEPKVLEHLTALEKAPDAFLPAQLDPKTVAASEETKRNQSFLENAYSPIVTGQETQAGAMNVLGEIASEYRPSPAVLDKASNDILGKLFKPAKDKDATINDYNKFFSGFAFKHPELSGGALDAAATAEWHKMKMDEMVVMGSSRQLPFMPIPGAFDSNGTPIILNKKGGIVSAAVNPQGINVGDAKADQKNVENLVKITGVLRSNEIEANKNFDQLTGLYKKLGNGTLPVLNNVANRIRDGLGAPEPGTAEGVAYEALTQYGRVVNKSTSAAGATDTARKEVNELLKVLKVNPAQFESKVAQYRKTMRNAMESQDEAIAQARRGGSGNKPIAPAGTQVPKRGGGFYTSDGKGGWQ